jgi:signal transduction histidine kinase
MSEPSQPAPAGRPSSRVVVVALYLFCLVTIGRTLASAMSSAQFRSQVGLVVGLQLAFLLLYSLTTFSGILRRGRPGKYNTCVPGPWLHLYFAVQSALLLVAYAQAPERDYITNLFIPLAYQAALSFSGQTLWVWIGAFATLTAGPLILALGLLRGLGLGLVTVVGEMIIAAYVVIDRDVVEAQARRHAMLLELQETHRQLERYAGEVEELAGLQERNRLAREIHDSVSQTLFSITLSARAVQLLLDKDPTRVRGQLEQLQSLVQSALAEMRGLIAQLRQRNEA